MRQKLTTPEKWVSYTFLGIFLLTFLRKCSAIFTARGSEALAEALSSLAPIDILGVGCLIGFFLIRYWSSQAPDPDEDDTKKKRD